MTLGDMVKETNSPPLSEPCSKDFERRLGVMKRVEDEESERSYVSEGFLYVNSEGVKSNASIDLKYGVFVWKDDLSGSIKGQILFEHVSRIAPGVLLEDGGELEASGVEMTMVCHDGMTVLLRAEDVVSAGDWRVTLENYVFEYGRPPPAPPPTQESWYQESESEETFVSSAPNIPLHLTDQQCETLASSATTDDLSLFKTAAIRNGKVSDQLHTVMDGTFSNLLHLCCLWGSDKVLSFLIDNNSINMNSANSKGETPLFVSCANGKVPCLQLLLTRDADHNKPAHGGKSLLGAKRRAEQSRSWRAALVPPNVASSLLTPLPFLTPSMQSPM